jgi:hypothetical protein
VALACDDAAAPTPTIAGAWDIVGYMDQGISATTTGTADFRPDSTFAMAGTVTFPAEPVDTFDVAGTWVQTGAIVTLTTPDGSDGWQLAAQGSTVSLTLQGTTPPTRITLARPAP